MLKVENGGIKCGITVVYLDKYSIMKRLDYSWLRIALLLFFAQHNHVPDTCILSAYQSVVPCNNNYIKCKSSSSSSYPNSWLITSYICVRLYLLRCQNSILTLKDMYINYCQSIDVCVFVAPYSSVYFRI